jgi:hypothetical protein
MNRRAEGIGPELERALEPVYRGLDQIKERVEEIARALQTRETVIQGWKAISAEVGCSERYARKLARRKNDPLPCHVRRGVVLALGSELRAWQTRRTRPLGGTRARGGRPADSSESG